MFARTVQLSVAVVVCSLCVAVSAAIGGAETVVSADPSAMQVDALNGVVAWAADGRVVVQRAGTIRRTAKLLRWDAAQPFLGVRAAQLDLGLDERGRVVVTFTPCSTGCPPKVLDAVTMRVRSLRVPVSRGCHLGPVALWRSRTLYAVTCRSGRTSIEVREGDQVRRLGPPVASTVDRVDLRGRLAVGYLGGTVTLMDTQRRCHRRIEGDYNDGQVPGYSRTLAPHVSDDLVTWARTSYHEEPLGTDHLDLSALAVVRAVSGCRLGRAPGLPPNAAGPVDWIAFDITRASQADATSVAVEGHNLWATLPGRGVVRYELDF